MSERLIVTIHDGIDPVRALDFVQAVIAEGRISNYGKAYCYATTFGRRDGSKVLVTADKRKASDSFRVSRIK
jgi:hypothetical protein